MSRNFLGLLCLAGAVGLQVFDLPKISLRDPGSESETAPESTPADGDLTAWQQKVRGACPDVSDRLRWAGALEGLAYCAVEDGARPVRRLYYTSHLHELMTETLDWLGDESPQSLGVRPVVEAEIVSRLQLQAGGSSRELDDASRQTFAQVCRDAAAALR